MQNLSTLASNILLNRAFSPPKGPSSPPDPSPTTLNAFTSLSLLYILLYVVPCTLLKLQKFIKVTLISNDTIILMKKLSISKSCCHYVEKQNISNIRIICNSAHLPYIPPLIPRQNRAQPFTPLGPFPLPSTLQPPPSILPTPLLSPSTLEDRAQPSCLLSDKK